MAKYYRFESSETFEVIEQDSVLRAVEDFLLKHEYQEQSVLFSGSIQSDTDPEWYADLTVYLPPNAGAEVLVLRVTLSSEPDPEESA